MDMFVLDIGFVEGISRKANNVKTQYTKLYT
jgi:hypothetical protein